MKVTTLRSTDDPEKLACQAGRGDYYDGFVGDTSFEDLMESVSFEERHAECVSKAHGYDLESDDCPPVRDTHAKKYALLERLFKRGHFGVWEHPTITLAVKGVSRSCMAQLTRHRHASFDVQSQRYVDFSEKDDPVAIPKSLTDTDHATRGEGQIDLTDHERDLFRSMFDSTESGFSYYEEMVDAGVPKEDARFILPIGTKVNFTMTVNARTLLHIANLRERADSQWEIRELTNKIIDEEFKNWMPLTYYLWRENGPMEISP